MNNKYENKLLKTVALIPLFIFFIFTIIFMWLTYKYHDKELQYEIKEFKLDFINKHKNTIKKEVHKIYNLIEYEYNSHKTIYKLPPKDIKQHIFELISSMKYDKNGYIFILDYNGTDILNPYKDVYRNKTNETKLLKAINEGINIAKNGEGYISYEFINQQKISYIIGFDKLHWVIGYGFYPDEIDYIIKPYIEKLKKEHSKYLHNLLIIAILMSIILYTILLGLANNTNKIFKEYKNTIYLKEIENREKEDIINHQSKLAILGKMINIISHQWRKPLAQINSIMVNIYVKHQNNSLDKNSLKKNIENMENITQYLTQTIDDFSDFFALEKEKQLFYINDSIKQCTNIINLSAIQIKLTSICKSTNQIQGYTTLFQQTVLTILTNAIDIFKINNTINPNITIHTYDKGVFTFIEISDNAGGIDEENLENIFNLYFSTKKNKKNEGLGLYIAKKIISQHFHGDIRATNIDNGALFTIKILSSFIK